MACRMGEHRTRLAGDCTALAHVIWFLLRELLLKELERREEEGAALLVGEVQDEVVVVVVGVGVGVIYIECQRLAG